MPLHRHGLCDSRWNQPSSNDGGMHLRVCQLGRYRQRSILFEPCLNRKAYSDSTRSYPRRVRRSVICRVLDAVVGLNLVYNRTCHVPIAVILFLQLANLHQAWARLPRDWKLLEKGQSICPSIRDRNASKLRQSEYTPSIFYRCRSHCWKIFPPSSKMAFWSLEWVFATVHSSFWAVSINERWNRRPLKLKDTLRNVDVHSSALIKVCLDQSLQVSDSSASDPSLKRNTSGLSKSSWSGSIGEVLVNLERTTTNGSEVLVNYISEQVFENIS